jgi:hypothetical protein
MAMGDPANLVERSNVAVQEKLQALAGIEVKNGVARPGQDIDESVDRGRPDLPLHPVDLGFLPGQEGQLGERFRALLAKLQRRLLDRPVAAGVAVPAQPAEDLEGHEGGCRLVPLGDQPLVGRDDRGVLVFLDRHPVENPRDGSSSHLELLGNLAPGQVLDFPEPPNLDPACLVHHPEDKSRGRQSRSRLVSCPPPGGQKRSPINTLEEYLVLYHPPSKSGRDNKCHSVQRLFRGDLVLYHRSRHVFPRRPPLLDVRVTPPKVAGIMFRPAVLGPKLTGLPTDLPPARRLPGPNPRIRPKVPPAELAMVEHLGPPQRNTIEAIIEDLRIKKFASSAAPPELQPNPLRLHQRQNRFPFPCRPQAGSRAHLGEDGRGHIQGVKIRPLRFVERPKQEPPLSPHLSVVALPEAASIGAYDGSGPGDGDAAGRLYPGSSKPIWKLCRLGSTEEELLKALGLEIEAVR